MDDALLEPHGGLQIVPRAAECSSARADRRASRSICSPLWRSPGLEDHPFPFDWRSTVVLEGRVTG